MSRPVGMGLLLVVCAAFLSVPAGAGDAPRTVGPYGAECRIAYSPDGKKLGVTTRGGSAALIDLETGRRAARFDGEREEAESAIAISPDGSRFALATLEGRVRVFDAKTGKEVTHFDHGGPVTSVAFTSDGKALVTGGGLPMGVEGPGASEPREHEEGEGEDEGEPDVGGSEAIKDGPTARVWDAASGEKLADLDAKTGNTSSAVAASPTATMVAVARHDGKLGLFELSAKKRLEVDLGAPSHAVAFSPDGTLIAALGGKDGAVITLVDVAKGEVLRSFPATDATGPGGPDGALAFSPSGHTLARTTPDKDGVQLFEVESGSLKRTLAQGPAAKGSLAFSPDGKTVAAGLRSGEVVLHDLAPPK